MRFKKNKNLILLLLVIITIVSCESDYSKLVKKEITTGEKKDSLFFGMKFNDTKQDFFDICQELNNKKLVTHGSQNRFVKYNMNPIEDGDSSIEMLFYGIFDKENIMTGMNMRFSYNGWSPWNKKYYADKLIPRIKDTLIEWFPGNEFMTVDLKKLNKETYVKVDGNRQIKMYTLDKKYLAVIIEDLNKKSEYNDFTK